MPSIDIFKDDAFGVVSLTEAINKTVAKPQFLASMGLFEEYPIATTSIAIEQLNGVLSLVPATQRGAPVEVLKTGKRKAFNLSTTHLATGSSIIADEVKNIRAFGKETETELVKSVVNARLQSMRDNIDSTIEYQRIGALNGKILDADGSSVIVDLHAQFGITQSTKGMALGTASTKVRNEIVKAKRMISDALPNVMVSKFIGFCSRDYYDAMVAHSSVSTAFDRWQNGEFFRSDLMEGFEFGGVQWVVYDAKVGTNKFISEGDALLVPVAAGMYKTAFAPADYIETVNTPGLPYYAKQEEMRMGKGVDIEAQSNPLSYVTRPEAIIKLSA